VPVRATPAARLAFVLAFLWALAWTLVFAPLVVVESTFRPGAETFQRWAGRWAKTLLLGCGVRLRVDDRARLAPGTPAVFVANHQNSLDILTTAAGVPYPFGFAAKAGLRRLPLIGWVLARTACLFVDRSTPRKAAESVIEAAARLRAGDAVLLFPEGGRSWSSVLQPFQKGAFVLAAQAGVPLVPVVVVGNDRRLDERRWALRPGPVRLVVGEPRPTAGRGKEAVPALMEEVRAWMEAELGRGLAATSPPAAPPAAGPPAPAARP
jgi:1-acyl-sn-glycerol-3-phosphate acyltransferase